MFGQLGSHVKRSLNTTLYKKKKSPSKAKFKIWKITKQSFKWKTIQENICITTGKDSLPSTKKKKP